MVVRQAPIVGRTNELRAIEGILARQDVAGVALMGTEGAGKSHLARHICERRKPPVHTALWVSATHSLRLIPFGAFAHLLPATLSVEGGLRNLLRAAAQSLLAGGHRRMPLLCVDDAHLLDDASAALVHHLALARAARLIVTVRSGETVPDSVAALWKDEFVIRVDVAPLRAADVRQVVQAELPGVIDDEVHQRVWDACQGNPLLTHELVSGAVDAKVIVQRAGAWRWEGLATMVPRLRELIEQRVGRLSPEERTVMEWIAVAERLDLSTLESMTRPAVLDALEQRRLVQFEHADRRTTAVLAHPLYGEVIRASALPRHLLGAVRQLAERLDRVPKRRRGDVLRLATLRLHGGLSGSSALMIEAGREAIRRYDYQLAERLARAAGEETDTALAVELLSSEALIGQGRLAEADVHLSKAASFCRTDVEHAELAVGRAQHLFWRLKNADAASAVLADAEAQVADPVWRDELACARATLTLFAGRAAPAIEIWRAILMRGVAFDRGLLQAGAGLALGLLMTGRTGEADAAIARALEAAERAHPAPNFPFPRQWLNVSAGYAALLHGDVAGALGQFQAAVVEPFDRAPEHRGAVLFFLGFTHRLQGHLQIAIGYLRQAAALLRDCGDPSHHLPACLAELAHALALKGETLEAAAVMSEAEQRKVETFRVDDVHFGQARTWLAAARAGMAPDTRAGAAASPGDREGASSHARHLADCLRTLDYRPLAALALFDLVRLGHADEVASTLNDLARTCDGRLVLVLASCAQAIAANDGRRLDAAVQALEELMFPLFAAEMAIAAIRLHRQAGHSTLAAAARERARRLAAQCDGAQRLPMLWHADDKGLTPREREIAWLASQGRSTRDIAEALGVSTRTVDNHLHAVYAKLGVAGRAELARLFASGW